VGAEGLETSSFPQGNAPLSQEGGAESGAVDVSEDTRLMRLRDCWDDLPEAVRISIAAIVDAHFPRTGSR